MSLPSKKTAVKTIKKVIKQKMSRSTGQGLGWKEFMAMPSGKPAPDPDQCVRLLCYKQGMIRKAGDKITVIFRDARKNKKCSSMKEAFRLVTTVKVKAVTKKKTKKSGRQLRPASRRRSKRH